MRRRKAGRTRNTSGKSIFTGAVARAFGDGGRDVEPDARRRRAPRSPRRATTRGSRSAPAPPRPTEVRAASSRSADGDAARRAIERPGRPHRARVRARPRAGPRARLGRSSERELSRRGRPTTPPPAGRAAAGSRASASRRVRRASRARRSGTARRRGAGSAEPARRCAPTREHRPRRQEALRRHDHCSLRSVPLRSRRVVVVRERRILSRIGQPPATSRTPRSRASEAAAAPDTSGSAPRPGPTRRPRRGPGPACDRHQRRAHGTTREDADPDERAALQARGRPRSPRSRAGVSNAASMCSRECHREEQRRTRSGSKPRIAPDSRACAVSARTSRAAARRSRSVAATSSRTRPARSPPLRRWSLSTPATSRASSAPHVTRPAVDRFVHGSPSPVRSASRANVERERRIRFVAANAIAWSSDRPARMPDGERRDGLGESVLRRSLPATVPAPDDHPRRRQHDERRRDRPASRGETRRRGTMPRRPPSRTRTFLGTGASASAIRPVETSPASSPLERSATVAPRAASPTGRPSPATSTATDHDGPIRRRCRPRTVSGRRPAPRSASEATTLRCVPVASNAPSTPVRGRNPKI